MVILVAENSEAPYLIDCKYTGVKHRLAVSVRDIFHTFALRFATLSCLLRLCEAMLLIIASNMGVSSIDDVLRFFNECTDALSRNGVFPWVMRQVIAQLILFISTYGASCIAYLSLTNRC